MTDRHLAILGAGPVGLEAALAAADAGFPFTVYEATSGVAGNVRSWGHVRLFTPWAMNVSERMRAALAAAGREPPDDDELCPTGWELLEEVFEPVAALPGIRDRIRLGTRVLEVGRQGLLKSEEIGTGRRGERPFRLLLRLPDGSERVEHADVVLDCTGTYHNPNALGAGGIRAPGEEAAADHIIRRIPDFEARFDGEAGEWEGQRVLLVGAGHSAQTAARDLHALARRLDDLRVTWAIRSEDPDFGAVEDDPLPGRQALVERAEDLASGAASPFDVRLGRSVQALRPSPEGIVVTLTRNDGGEEEVVVDRIISLTGSVGDARMYRQLQVHECYATSGPMRLAAALLASASADCLAQESQGVDILRNPEPDFYILGSKSYGRNNTFLMRVGWEQVDEVFSILAPEAVAQETG